MTPSDVLIAGPAAPRRSLAGLMRQELTDVANFLRAPRRRRPRRSATNAEVAARVAFHALLGLAIALAVAIPVQYLLKRLAGIDAMMPDHPPALLWLALVVFAPVTEEIVFRAGLRRAGASLFLMPPLVAVLVSWQVGAALAVVCTIIAGIDRIRVEQMAAGRALALRMARGREYVRRFRHIVWLYIAAFGLVHVGNFSIPVDAGWSALLVVFALPAQLFLGVLLSYLRLRHGILSAIACHGLYNSMVVLLFL